MDKQNTKSVAHEKTPHKEELHERRALGKYIIYTLSVLCIYNLTMEYVGQFKLSSSANTYITVLGVSIIALIFLHMIKKMGLSLNQIGFTTRNWRLYVEQSIVWSLVFCLFLLILKFFLIYFTPFYKELSLLDPSLQGFIERPSVDFVTWLTSGALYIIFAPIQAFIIQGGIQSPLIHFLPHKNAALVSIFIATLYFGALHIDLHFAYAFAVMLPGLVWAIMFAKQRSLVGVGLSHSIIGFFAFWVMGYEKILHISSLLFFR